jgi:FKBP-type peptidyl-prolyl cis-trans isomerase
MAGMHTDTGQQAPASALGLLYLDKGGLVLLSPGRSGYFADARYAKACATTTQRQGSAFQRIDTWKERALSSSGRTLTVNYTGCLYDASKADFKGRSSIPRSARRHPFRLDASSVITGWKQRLLGMRAGASAPDHSRFAGL